MTLSLRARLFLGSLLAVWAALALLTLLALREERAWVEGQARTRLERDAHAAAAALAQRQGPAALQPLVHRFAGDREHRYTLIDRSGRVLADSDVADDQVAAMENHGGRPEVRSALA